MINLAKWCVESEETFAKHKLRRMAVNAATQTQAVNAIAKAIPDYYTDPQRVASLLKKLGKPAAAAHVEQKLPTKISIRSGDLGEILCRAGPRQYQYRGDCPGLFRALNFGSGQQ